MCRFKVSLKEFSTNIWGDLFVEVRTNKLEFNLFNVRIHVNLKAFATLVRRDPLKMFEK